MLPAEAPPIGVVVVAVAVPPLLAPLVAAVVAPPLLAPLVEAATDNVHTTTPLLFGGVWLVGKGDLWLYENDFSC